MMKSLFLIIVVNTPGLKNQRNTDGSPYYCDGENCQILIEAYIGLLISYSSFDFYKFREYKINKVRFDYQMDLRSW